MKTSSEHIMNLAEKLIQTKGYNAFSYGDIAAEIGVATSAIHYYFATKNTLTRRIVQRHRKSFLKQLATIDIESSTEREKLDRYINLCRQVIVDSEREDQGSTRICICGMLGAEYESLPNEVREEVSGFFTDNETWLADVLQNIKGDNYNPADPRLIIGSIEGFMIMSRINGCSLEFDCIAKRMIEYVLALNA